MNNKNAPFNTRIREENVLISPNHMMTNLKEKYASSMVKTYALKEYDESTSLIAMKQRNSYNYIREPKNTKTPNVWSKGCICIFF